MKDIEQYNKNLWKQVQTDVGVSIHPLIRGAIEELARTGTNNIEKYKRNIYAYATTQKLVEEEGCFPSPKKKIKNEKRQRYQRSFQKRLHLVQFVIHEQLNVKPRRKYLFHHQSPIPWEKICEAWNRDHEYDQMTKEVLKASYYRAKQDRDLYEEYFKIKNREAEQIHQKSLDRIRTEVEGQQEKLSKLKWLEMLSNDPNFYKKHYEDISCLIKEGLKSNQSIQVADERYYTTLLMQEREKVKHERTHSKKVRK